MGQSMTLPPPSEITDTILEMKSCDRAFVVQPNGKVLVCQNGTLYLTENVLYFYSNSKRFIGIPYKVIEECTVIDHFSGRGAYFRPCCCSCVPNYLVNIIANVNGEKTRAAICVMQAEEYVEKINRAKIMGKDQRHIFKPIQLPSDIKSNRIETTVGDHAFVVMANGKTTTCQDKGTLFLTDGFVYYYATPLAGRSYRLIGIPYGSIEECTFIEEFSDESKNLYHKPSPSGNMDWTNGLVNIVAIVNGQKVLVAIAVVHADEFVEKINESVKIAPKVGKVKVKK